MKKCYKLISGDNWLTKSSIEELYLTDNCNKALRFLLNQIKKDYKKGYLDDYDYEMFMNQVKLYIKDKNCDTVQLLGDISYQINIVDCDEINKNIGINETIKEAINNIINEDTDLEKLKKVAYIKIKKKTKEINDLFSNKYNKMEGFYDGYSCLNTQVFSTSSFIGYINKRKNIFAKKTFRKELSNNGVVVLYKEISSLSINEKSVTYWFGIYPDIVVSYTFYARIIDYRNNKIYDYSKKISNIDKFMQDLVIEYSNIVNEANNSIYETEYNKKMSVLFYLSKFLEFIPSEYKNVYNEIRNIIKGNNWKEYYNNDKIKKFENKYDAKKRYKIFIRLEGNKIIFIMYNVKYENNFERISDVPLYYLELDQQQGKIIIKKNNIVIFSN